jgi:microcystin-dependent protein
MSSPFVAEIRMFGFNFAPKGWAFCDGQLLPISQNTALFSLLGTFYGGDGKSTFALPDFQGSCALGQGQSTTGTQYFIGEESGVQFVTLLQSEIPVHTHSVGTQSNRAAVNPLPAPDQIISKAAGGSPFLVQANGNDTMAPQTIGPAGGSLPHNNMQPYLTLNFCIALQGVFPPRG